MKKKKKKTTKSDFRIIPTTRVARIADVRDSGNHYFKFKRHNYRIARESTIWAVRTIWAVSVYPPGIC